MKKETWRLDLCFGMRNLLYSKNWCDNKYASAWAFGVQFIRNCASPLPQSLVTLWSDPL